MPKAEIVRGLPDDGEHGVERGGRTEDHLVLQSFVEDGAIALLYKGINLLIGDEVAQNPGYFAPGLYIRGWLLL